MYNPLLDAEFLDLAYIMQNMGRETVSNLVFVHDSQYHISLRLILILMSKFYTAMVKLYHKHKPESLEKFCPNPEHTLSQQLVVWKQGRYDLLEDHEERKKKPKENPNIWHLKWERANLQGSLGP
jgi:hypothetical protein